MIVQMQRHHREPFITRLTVPPIASPSISGNNDLCTSMLPGRSEGTTFNGTNRYLSSGLETLIR